MNRKKITLFMEYQDGSAQTWGYDYPQLLNDENTQANMAADFPTLPENLKRDPIAKATVTVDYEEAPQRRGTFTLPELTGADLAAWVFGHIEALEEQPTAEPEQED